MANRIRKAAPHVTQSEGLIFEKSSPGKYAYSLPALDVPAVDATKALGAGNVREEIPGFPEVSEIEIIRHFTRISTWNYGIDSGMYPLGSCTMKYNPRVNEIAARTPGLATEHPYQPDDVSQGCLKLLKLLEDCLTAITGMDAVTLQPAAGAHGELTGILLAKAYHESKGSMRTTVLVPDSAHGTNPATAAVAGYQVRSVPSNSEGRLDLEALRSAMTEDVAALMITNPNTLGIFEQDILAITEVVHSKGGLVYMDGANMNALAGVARPGDFGIDMVHLNLHKTFSTPHGGGGPGAGPVAVKKILEPYLPTPVLREEGGALRWDYDRPESVGKVRAQYGNFGVLVRALSYILANGPDGLRQTTEDAVLNANYVRQGLADVFELPFDSPTLHECVFSDKRQSKGGVSTMDIAKRLIDYGFHPYTVAFPLIVHGALMIEPTESESREELDLFIDAMKAIAEEAESDPEMVKNAPHTTRVRRLDEVAAARKPKLRWTPED
jgi:glycine dehydrogenase subunit 2